MTRNLVRNGWLPDQHGAWAMTFAPLILGIALSGGSWIQIPLSIAWLAAYMLFNVYTLWSKSHRRDKYTPALFTYAFIGMGSAAIVISSRPSIWVWGIPLLILFLWSLGGHRRGRGRSFGSRLAPIMAASLMTPIAYSLGSEEGSWERVTVATIYMALFFIGTIPYVRTMIRKRGNRNWLIGSVVYHSCYLLLTIIAILYGVIAWWSALIVALLLFRAWVLPTVSARAKRPIRPAPIGFTEFFMTALVFIAAYWGTA